MNIYSRRNKWGEELEIQESIAVVTGGASGLGAATVRNIIKKGGKAVICDLSEENGAKLVQELGDSVLFVKTDVTSEESVLGALEKGIEKFQSINTVVNCAGIAIAEKVIGRKGAHELKAFSNVVTINLVGTFNVIRLAAEKMAENEPNQEGERGVIINTASVVPLKDKSDKLHIVPPREGLLG